MSIRLKFPVIFTAIALGICACKDHAATGSNAPATSATVMHEQNSVAATARGREIFQRHCIACHGLNGAPQNNISAADLQVSVLDSNEMARVIRNGRNRMPMFGPEAMPDSDIGHVVQYVKSLHR